MTITIPNNNIAERKYIINMVFSEFLGVDYNLVINNGELKIDNWIIELENGNKLTVEDYFFNRFPDTLEYLKEENIPQSVEFTKNRFIPENDIPIIFGTSHLESTATTLNCGIDIFASIFFMLTRWEEYVNRTRDVHNRFPATASLAYKWNFLQRPIVNEYLEMLKNMLLAMGFNGEFKSREYRLILTHDIDHIYAWDSFGKFLSNLLRDLIKRTSIDNFFYTLYRYINFQLGKELDPYDTYDYIMDLSESIGLKSYFFFMGEGVTKHDNSYRSSSKEAKAIVENILRRGHFVGIHPSYNAYNDLKQFKREKEELERNFNTSIRFGREHYLRFELPTTWQIWEDSGMDWESTLAYADEDGFRCGVCYEFHVFNILRREQLQLKERPLLFMDANGVEKFSPQRMEEVIYQLICQVERYRGDFVLLWHNSSYNTIKWKKFKRVYESIIDYHFRKL